MRLNRVFVDFSSKFEMVEALIALNPLWNTDFASSES